MQKNGMRILKLPPPHNFCSKPNFEILRKNTNYNNQGYFQLQFQIFSSNNFLNILFQSFDN